MIVQFKIDGNRVVGELTTEGLVDVLLNNEEFKTAIVNRLIKQEGWVTQLSELLYAQCEDYDKLETQISTVMDSNKKLNDNIAAALNHVNSRYSEVSKITSDVHVKLRASQQELQELNKGNTKFKASVLNVVDILAFLLIVFIFVEKYIME